MTKCEAKSGGIGEEMYDSKANIWQNVMKMAIGRRN